MRNVTDQGLICFLKRTWSCAKCAKSIPKDSELSESPQNKASAPVSKQWRISQLLHTFYFFFMVEKREWQRERERERERARKKRERGDSERKKERKR